MKTLHSPEVTEDWGVEMCISFFLQTTRDIPGKTHST